VQEYLNTFSVYFTEMQQYGGIEYLKNRIVNSGAWESLKNSLPAQFSSSITKKEKVGGTKYVTVKFYFRIQSCMYVKRVSHKHI
jgi:hypothetical protein